MTKLSIILVSLLFSATVGFQVLSPQQQPRHRVVVPETRNLVLCAVKTEDDEMTRTVPFFATLEGEDKSSSTNTSPPAAKTAKSLQEKMANWEASEEEIKAATLGGVSPGGLGGRKGNDGFDVGLYIAFPFMILGSLLFAFFPFIMDKIDVSSVGPPPMM